MTSPDSSPVAESAPKPTGSDGPSCAVASGSVSRLEYFAGCALAGMIASGKAWSGSTEVRVALTPEKDMAMAAFQMAKIMEGESQHHSPNHTIGHAQK